MRHLLLFAPLMAGCTSGHGPIAEEISAALGEPVPYASDEQLETFQRGLEVANRRFDLDDGLGPAFNVTFCASCHERPTVGGSAGSYRSFFIAARRTEDGAFQTAHSAGDSSGVIRLYQYGEDVDAKPFFDPEDDIIGRRNPIPFYGTGLIALITEEEILKLADPDDEDGDGISGRPNYDQGFVGRFGRKAQTVSIEGFIRGPLFNHIGITTDPLTEAQKAALPVDSSSDGFVARRYNPTPFTFIREAFAQAAAPSSPLVDDDDAPDPELSTDDLFDLVSMTMLMAAPVFEEPTEMSERGRDHFDELGCGDCHTPRLDSERGPIPLYSDLLLHDLGPEMSDGLLAGEATGDEFRTQPLWGIVAVGPYLHDGRATTIDEAILWHGGEGSSSRAAYMELTEDEKEDLMEFLYSLGGRSQYTEGLIPPDQEPPGVGEWGGPLEGTDMEWFEEGLLLFDREFGAAHGAGAPRLNGDSCRACHFEPVVGGAGPRGVNVMRHGILTDDGAFAVPAVGTILHRTTALLDVAPRAQPEANIFEHRQPPHVLGLGLIDDIDESTILAGADPNDEDGDGISGKPSWTDGGQLGRFGWKAQVPSIDEFVRDAVTAELGMTLPWVEGMTFGRVQDNDDVPDPEMSLEEAELLGDLMRSFAPPPRTSTDPELEEEGELVFAEVGCDSCHTPSLDGVPLYSDLLLHAILPEGSLGIEDASAEMDEFRTPPLWGVARTAPYLHSGAADTIEQAITMHAGEATAVVDLFESLSADDRAALIAFVSSL